jgi:hypothetical protein
MIKANHNSTSKTEGLVFGKGRKTNQTILTRDNKDCAG